MSRTVDWGGYLAPGIELLYERAPGRFRAQWDRLQSDLAVVRPRPDQGDRRAPHLALAVNGKQPRSDLWPTGGDGLPATSNGAPVASQGPGSVEVGVHHDNVAGRIRASDQLGIDVQVLNAGSTVVAARWLPANLGAGILGAFNRFSIAYAAQAPDRLRAVLQIHGGEPEWSAAEVRELAGEHCVAAATIWLPGVAPDDPRFAPIWQALNETGLPLLHRPNVCSPIWTAQRLLAVLRFAGILADYPEIRVVFGQAGTAWVAPWFDRMIDVTRDEAREPPGAADVADGRLFVCAAPDDDPAESLAAGAHLGAVQILWESGFPYRLPAPLGAGVDDPRMAWATNGSALVGGRPAAVSTG